MSRKTDGMVLLNQGDFVFKLLLPQSTKIVDGIIVKKTPVSEEQKAEEQAMEDELAEFEAQLEEELAAEAEDAVAKRKAKVAAAKAKRIAEEATNAAEAELAEELGQ